MRRLYNFFVNFLKNRKRMMSDTELNSAIGNVRMAIGKIEDELDSASNLPSKVVYESSLDAAHNFLKNLERIKKTREELANEKNVRKFDDYLKGQTDK